MTRGLKKGKKGRRLEGYSGGGKKVHGSERPIGMRGKAHKIPSTMGAGGRRPPGLGAESSFFPAVKGAGKKGMGHLEKAALVLGNRQKSPSRFSH